MSIKPCQYFNIKKPKHDQHSPHTHTTPKYVPTIQYAPPSTTSNITGSQIIYFQQVIYTLLFYARFINSTMLTIVGYIDTNIFTYQWDNINNRINHFLDHTSTHPYDKLTHHKSDINLWVHIDDSYLTEPK